MWYEVYITIYIITPYGGASSESSNRGEGGTENGKTKFASYMRHGFTIGCSPFIRDECHQSFVQRFSFLSHATASGIHEWSKCALFHLDDSVVIHPFLFRLVFMEDFVYGAAVGDIAVMKHPNVIETFLHGVPDSSGKYAQPCCLHLH